MARSRMVIGFQAFRGTLEYARGAFAICTRYNPQPPCPIEFAVHRVGAPAPPRTHNTDSRLTKAEGLTKTPAGNPNTLFTAAKKTSVPWSANARGWWSMTQKAFPSTLTNGWPAGSGLVL